MRHPRTPSPGPSPRARPGQQSQAALPVDEYRLGSAPGGLPGLIPCLGYVLRLIPHPKTPGLMRPLMVSGQWTGCRERPPELEREGRRRDTAPTAHVPRGPLGVTPRGWPAVSLTVSLPSPALQGLRCYLMARPQAWTDGREAQTHRWQPAAWGQRAVGPSALSPASGSGQCLRLRPSQWAEQGCILAPQQNSQATSVQHLQGTHPKEAVGPGQLSHSGQ